MRSFAIIFLKIFAITALLFLFFYASGVTHLFAHGLFDQITEALRTRLTFSKKPLHLFCTEEQLCGSNVLPRFYGLRSFSPAWITEKGVRAQAYELIRAIYEVGDEGLNPKDYHLDGVEVLLEEIEILSLRKAEVPIEKLVDLELLLSDAFFLYASHLTTGRVNPETIHSEWTIKNQNVDLVRILLHSIDKGNITDALKTVSRQTPDYQRLKKASRKYRKFAENGGWVRIPGGRTMKKGDRGTRIALLHSRLLTSGDLRQTADKNPVIFDKALEKAVLKFQKRHGLVEDGIVGRATLFALNMTASDRFKQIMVNMERWRWLHRNFGPRYLIVNIADFQATVVEENTRKLTMRAVVGKDYRRTPVFEGKMTYLVINPFWRIPQKLAVEDFLPLVKRNQQVLKNKKIRVYESWAYGALEIDPESFDWKMVQENNFSFKLVQEPGPLNPLGRIKFIFPNKFSVYLHDTPAKHLFSVAKRNFSSGCIRIEKPIELAAYLLQDHPDWTKQRIQDTIDSMETQKVKLSNPIEIRILYFTAWVDKQGTVNFRNDIYKRDSLLAKALEEKPPFKQ